MHDILRKLTRGWLPRRRLGQVSLLELLLLGTSLVVVGMTLTYGAVGQLAFFNACGCLGAIVALMVAKRWKALSPAQVLVIGPVAAALCGSVAYLIAPDALDWSKTWTERLPLVSACILAIGSGTLVSCCFVIVLLPEIADEPERGGEADRVLAMLAVLGVLVMVFESYWLAYRGLVQRKYPVYGGGYADTPGWTTDDSVAKYRLGDSFAETVFLPAHQLDRRLRRKYWDE